MLYARLSRRKGPQGHEGERDPKVVCGARDCGEQLAHAKVVRRPDGDAYGLEFKGAGWMQRPDGTWERRPGIAPPAPAPLLRPDGTWEIRPHTAPSLTPEDLAPRLPFALNRSRLSASMRNGRSTRSRPKLILPARVKCPKPKCGQIQVVDETHLGVKVLPANKPQPQ
jgi:hypothetical protein